MERKKKKTLTTALAVAVAALLLIGGGTFAYFQSQSIDVINMFNANKVTVNLTETTGSNYDIIPGTSETKDPKVTVDNSIDAYVYVTVTDNTDGMVKYDIADGWKKLDGVDNVYYKDVEASDDPQEFYVLKDNTVTYDAALENSDMLNSDGTLKDGITLSFKASAVQKAPFNDPVKAFYQADTVVKLEQNAAASEVNGAINAAEGKTAIVISSDITTADSITIPANKDIVLSLTDDAEIVSEKQGAHAIKNEGKLTVMGGSVDATQHATAAVYNEAGATATLENVTLTRSQEAGTDGDHNGGNSYYVVLNHGTMTMDNCDVSADGKYSSLIENGWQNGNQNTTKTRSELTINGGTYSGGINTVKNDDYGELIINDGVFKNVAQYALMNHHIATINGGTFVSSVKSAIYNCACDATMDKGILNVSGGTFTYPSNYYGIYDVDTAASTITITGGKFATEHISNKSGFTPVQNSDGTYSVQN